MRVGKDFIVDIISHLASLKRTLSVLQLAQILGCSDSQLYKAMDQAYAAKLPAHSLSWCPSTVPDCVRAGQIGRAVIRSAGKVAQ
jgi:hypothetical protein